MDDNIDIESDDQESAIDFKNDDIEFGENELEDEVEFDEKHQIDEDIVVDDSLEKAKNDDRIELEESDLSEED